MVSSLFIRLAVVLLAFGVEIFAYPDILERDAAAAGKKIVLPPRTNDTGIKQIPDADHPFKAPGPNDQRGPCPGLNTMANHGYISRNGVTSFEEIINGAVEAFNMDHDLAAALAAFGMMARGNSFTDQLSIGGPSPLVPPLPGNIDGPVTRGLATHGRFEGDVSMTRQDAAIGDNRNFQVDLYDTLLLHVGEFGDDSPDTGNRSIVTVKVMQEFKWTRFVTDQKANPQLEYHDARVTLSYGESSFTLNFFANGTTGLLSVPTMGSFFRNQTFPNNWHRRSSPGTIGQIGDTAGAIFEAHPVLPGANAPNGTYIPDPPPGPCDLYNSIIGESIPAVLGNTTGLLKENVDVLSNALFAVFAGSSSCVQKAPGGPADT